MGKDYVNVRKRDEVVKPYNPDIYTFGCFSESGELVAYYLFEHFTNFIHTVKGIGHSDYLNMGIMNYLFAYSVSELSKLRKGNYLIYGRMDNDGLSRFKKNVGCRPVYIIYNGTKNEFKALNYFMSHFTLHDDSALNFVHEYILSKNNPK